MTIPVQVFTKDPNAVLDYKIDWASGGANDGSSTDRGWLQSDTISTSTWIVPTGIAKTTDTKTTTTTTIWLSGGTAGTAYEVTNRIVTAGGRTDDRTIRIEVQER